MKFMDLMAFKKPDPILKPKSSTNEMILQDTKVSVMFELFLLRQKKTNENRIINFSEVDRHFFSRSTDTAGPKA